MIKRKKEKKINQPTYYKEHKINCSEWQWYEDSVYIPSSLDSESLNCIILFLFGTGSSLSSVLLLFPLFCEGFVVWKEKGMYIIKGKGNGIKNLSNKALNMSTTLTGAFIVCKIIL